MKINGGILILFALFTVAGMSTVAFPQSAAPIKPSVVLGEVSSMEPGKIALQTKDGAIDVMLSETTLYKRVPPDNPTFKAAVEAALTDVGSGDKLAVQGILAADKKTFAARAVYIMTKADISQKQVKDSERWATRGVSGRVASVDTITNQVKLEVRGLGATTNIVLTPKEGAKLLRYAPNSVKFSEATTSTIGEIQAGDMLRALGDRSADGASFAAEEIITGAFRTVAGAVKSIDVAKNEIVISDSQTQKDLTVELGNASLLKKFPEEMAQRMAAMQGGPRPGGPGAGGPGGAVRPPADGAPSGAQPGTQPGQGGGGRPGGGASRGGIDDMLDRFPTISVSDLKVGEVIAVSSTRTNNLERITAIKVLAGVEPFLRAAQAQAAANGGQRRQGTLSLDIPGLDGFGGP